MALGKRFGKQVCRIAAFGQQLGEQLSLGTTLWSSAGEQLLGGSFRGGLEEQLCTAAVKNFSFGEHLFERNFRGAAFGSNATLGSSFRESLCRIALGTGLKHSRFGANALQRCFGEQLWEAASGNLFGEQLWQAVRGNFQEQLL